VAKYLMLIAVVPVISANLAAQGNHTPISLPFPPSDSQAVTVVQAAIAALGGATAIGQVKKLGVQGALQGMVSSDAWSETIFPNGSSPARAKWIYTSATSAYVPSLFMPSLLGPILLNESQDPYYAMRYGGPTILGLRRSQKLFFTGEDLLPTAQVWYFDTKTSLPVRIIFNLPAEIGQARSPFGTFVLSDYQPVSGILYPFHIVASIPGSRR